MQTEQPLRGMELQEKAQKDYSIQEKKQKTNES